MQFWPKLLCSKLFESRNSKNHKTEKAGLCNSFRTAYSCTNLGELNRKDLYEGLLDKLKSPKCLLVCFWVI